jgi:N-acetylmuramoyl-L-alanine amidase
VLSGTAALYFRTRAPAERAVLGPAEFQTHTLVIDPGHGGEDGGAVSPGGVIESGINLAIAGRMDLLAGLYGVPTVLLRTEDISLHDDTARTLREKKVSDLHNRVAMVEGTENATLISIHQNSYQDSRYSGAQVFYSNESLSADWAALTQESLRLALDQENDRVAKVIPDSIYLMNHITCPALLIECGFLSNPEEEALLQSERYQTRLAAAILAAYLQYQGNL